MFYAAKFFSDGQNWAKMLLNVVQVYRIDLGNLRYMFGSLGFKKKNMVRTPKKRAFFYWEKWAANEGSIY